MKSVFDCIFTCIWQEICLPWPFVHPRSEVFNRPLRRLVEGA